MLRKKLMAKRIVARFNGNDGETDRFMTSLNEIKIAVKFFNPVGTGVWYCYKRFMDGSQSLEKKYKDLVWCYGTFGSLKNARFMQISIQELESMMFRGYPNVAAGITPLKNEDPESEAYKNRCEEIFIFNVGELKLAKKAFDGMQEKNTNYAEVKERFNECARIVSLNKSSSKAFSSEGEYLIQIDDQFGVEHTLSEVIESLKAGIRL